MSIFRYFNLQGVHSNSVGSVGSEEKEHSERTQIFHFNNSEVKQHSEQSERFHFNSSESKTP